MKRLASGYHQGLELTRVHQQLLREERAHDRLAAQAPRTTTSCWSWVAPLPRKIASQIAGFAQRATPPTGRPPSIDHLDNAVITPGRDRAAG